MLDSLQVALTLLLLVERDRGCTYLRDLFSDYSTCEAFQDSGLTDTGRTDQLEMIWKVTQHYRHRHRHEFVVGIYETYNWIGLYSPGKN